MCVCTSPTLDVVEDSIRRGSLQEEGIREAEKHKWILSERAGCDRGIAALLDWVDQHWSGYLRARWLEHLQGVSYWTELNAEDFGLLRDRFCGSELLGEIVRQFLDGGENLTILNWALRIGLPIDPVFEILLVIDINSCRLKCELEQSLRPDHYRAAAS
jgi:hypothetical protein